jgi:hypothetical protein
MLLLPKAVHPRQTAVVIRKLGTSVPLQWNKSKAEHGMNLPCPLLCATADEPRISNLKLQCSGHRYPNRTTGIALWFRQAQECGFRVVQDSNPFVNLLS